MNRMGWIYRIGEERRGEKRRKEIQCAAVFFCILPILHILFNGSALRIPPNGGKIPCA
jgi:hypothetical protein